MFSPSISRTCSASAGRIRERRKEACREIGAEAARAGEIGIRRDERRAGRLDGHHRERLGREHHPAAVRAGGEQRQEGASDRGSRRIHLGDRLVGLDLEREIEPAGGRELGEQVIEQGHARGDVRLAAAEREPGAAHSSARSMSAPSARRRSSMRS